jgi:hypothetical protein
VIGDLVKAIALLFKFSGGFAEILYLLVLLQVLVLLVLQLLFEESIRGQQFLELLLQPIHRNSVTLFHPLKCGPKLGSICMVEVSAQYWLDSIKVLKLV